MSRDDPRRKRRRLVVWLVVTLCVLAELVGLGLVRAHGANGLPAPVISPIGLPTDPTGETSATFMFTDERSADFRCVLDEREPTACGVGLFGSASYAGPLARGPHVFRVRAATPTETSEPASYSWTVVASADDTPPSGVVESGADQGTGESSGAEIPFDIAGDVDGLAPGITKAIALTLQNPSPETIYVTEVTVEISDDSTPPGCPSGQNISLQQPTGITAASPVVLAGHGSVVLTSYPRAPSIGLRNQPWNQDVCKGKSFHLTYAGSAHS